MKTPRNLLGLWPDKEWPFREHEGAGLAFIGRVSDTLAFTSLMADYGCHPKAAQRILSRMAVAGADLLTVRLSVPDARLKSELAGLGVHMAVIPPQPNWEPRFEDGPWRDEDLPEWIRNR